MPLFCFAFLAASCALLFALPALTARHDLPRARPQRRLPLLRRRARRRALLWQHLFWIFGHPEVYIIILPAFGIATSIIPTFTQRRMVAFPLVALAELLVAFIGFGVWAHHMFATGLPTVTVIFFAAATGDGRDPERDPDLRLVHDLRHAAAPRFKTPLLFIVGFIVFFVDRRAVRDHVRRRSRSTSR